MNFDERFPDTRDASDDRLKQSQSVMLRLLKIFTFLCNQYNIEYFLVGGSLIGAIRHQGFIPWDDDLDVGMTRLNYEKFVKYAVQHLPKDIFFQTSETDPAYPACDYVDAKLRDKYSSYTVNRYKYHDGIQLDIFVYDQAFLPSNTLIILQNSLLNKLNSDLRRSKVLKAIQKNFPFKLVYASNYLHKLSNYRTLGTYFKSKELEKLLTVKFEDMEVSIPAGYDAHLKRQYGNYMELPPVEKRGGHHDALPDPFTPCNHHEILHWK